MTPGRVRVLFLALADALCIAFAWAFVVCAYRLLGWGRYAPSDYLKAWPVIVVFLAINFFSGLYHGRGTYPSMPFSLVEEFRRLLTLQFPTLQFPKIHHSFILM